MGSGMPRNGCCIDRRRFTARAAVRTLLDSILKASNDVDGTVVGYSERRKGEQFKPIQFRILEIESLY